MGIAMSLRSFVLAFTLSIVSAATSLAATITDAGGRTVEVPDHISKVLAAGPPASVLIYVLAPEKLAGWVREPKEKEKRFLLPSVRDLPTYGRLTGKGGDANIEMILKAKPDVIIDVGTVNETYVSLADRVQKQTGIPYILIDGKFSDTPKSLRELGKILGVSERGDKLAAYAEDAMKAVDGVKSKLPADKRPKVYYGRGPKGLETGLGGSINMEILDAVGASNVAAGAGKGSLTEVSLEQVLAWKPEVIFAADGKFAEAAATDPSWASIPAVQQKRIFKTPDVPFGWIDSPPGVNRLIGVSWLTAVLYPELKTGDVRAETRDFFKLYYQVDLSDADLDQLLAGVSSKP